MAEHRDQFLADVFNIVEPDDIRWVYISHDDVDHTGNLNALMAAPAQRQRWVGDGDSLDIGDRILHAVRPPIFDSPTTRGLYDPTTGVYWSADSFATPMPTPVTTVADLDADSWQLGINTFAATSARGSRWSTTPASKRPSTASTR